MVYLESALSLQVAHACFDSPIITWRRARRWRKPFIAQAGDMYAFGIASIEATGICWPADLKRHDC